MVLFFINALIFEGGLGVSKGIWGFPEVIAMVSLDATSYWF
jgi:hypothetical protein